MASTPYADIRIKLPLPVGLGGDLIEVINARYPDTAIVTDHGFSGELVLRVPNPSYPKGPLPSKVKEASGLFDDTDMLTRIEDDDIDFDVSSEVGRHVISWAKVAFAECPTDDYLEFQVIDANTEEIFTVVVSRPRAASPIALCSEMEDENEWLREEVAQLRRDNERLRDRLGLAGVPRPAK